MKTSPSGPWAISIRTTKKNIMKVIPQNADETLKQCLERTKGIIRDLRIKYADRHDMVIELISRRKAFPMPDKTVLKRKALWCPYCVKPREFKTGQLVEFDGISYLSDYHRCVVCGISTNDFYVKTYNHLWPNIRMMK